jgi:thiamine pyrophosphate-dependent acetolactate synthase large subunit-like protein
VTSTGAQALTGALNAHGVDLVWGIPGTHNLDLYAALAPAGIRHAPARHEQGAAFAADGYARATGEIGVCVTTSGPGVLNAATAMAQAWSDSVPVLLVAAGLPLRHPGRGNGYLHETRDIQGAMEGIVSYSHRVTSVEEIPTAVAQAFGAMRFGRPRPVYLEVPFDVLAERAVVEAVAPVPPTRASADSQALASAAERLSAARRPALIAGGGALRAPSSLRAMADRLGAPVVTTFNGKGSLPSSHPLCVGTGLHHRTARELVEDSDVVLVVGSELAPADLWDGPLPLDRRLIRIDVDPTQVVTNARPEVALAGDAHETLERLLATMPAPETDPVAAAGDVAARALAWRGRMREEIRKESDPWEWVLAPLADALGDRGVLAGDSAMACYYGAAGRVPAERPRCFLYPTGYGTLGYGLPAGIGAKLARPDDPVVVLIGDGGIMFTVAELAAAAQLGLGLPVLVVDNGGYGEIRAEMITRGDEPVAVDIPSMDFPSLARALGCHGRAVAGAADLADALPEALAADRPTVLHARLPA